MCVCVCVCVRVRVHTYIHTCMHAYIYKENMIFRCMG